MKQNYFDTLPLHPQPQPLESFTSYLTRVAEANGIRRYSQLNPFFGEYHSISHFADYPPPSFGMLPVLTSCGETELLRTTFYHVGKKFGKVDDLPWPTEIPFWSYSFFIALLSSLLTGSFILPSVMAIPPFDGLSQTRLSPDRALWPLQLSDPHFPLSISYGHLSSMWRGPAGMYSLKTDRGGGARSMRSIPGNRFSPLSASMGDHRTSFT